MDAKPSSFGWRTSTSAPAEDRPFGEGDRVTSHGRRLSSTAPLGQILRPDGIGVRRGFEGQLMKSAPFVLSAALLLTLAACSSSRRTLLLLDYDVPCQQLCDAASDPSLPSASVVASAPDTPVEARASAPRGCRCHRRSRQRRLPQAHPRTALSPKRHSPVPVRYAPRHGSPRFLLRICFIERGGHQVIRRLPRHPGRLASPSNCLQTGHARIDYGPIWRAGRG
jgi:hypothetical protein